MPRHGTWTETGGGGPGPGVVVAAIIGAVFLFGGGTVAAVTAAVTELLIAAAVIAGVIVVTAIGLLAWWMHNRPAREARARAVYAAQAEAYRADQAELAAARHQRALELARASAPVIAIDPAAIAAVLDLKRHPWPARAVRAEVEQ